MGRKRRSVEDFAAEVEAHLQIEADRLIAEGMAPDEARLAARRNFGNTVSAQERFYESRRRMWLDHLWNDARVASRSLTRYPIACAVAVISLAIGIGSATATLTVRDIVFRNPPPLYADSERLSWIEVVAPERMPGGVPGPLYRRWDDELGSSGALAASRQPSTLDVRVDQNTVDQQTLALPIRAVSPNLFATLGVQAMLGRTFDASQAMQTGATPAVLSHGVWQRAFNARRDIVGTPLWIDGRPHLVIGVLPERFWFATMFSAIWTPLDTRALMAEDMLSVVVRRHRGVTHEALADQLQRAVADYAASLPADQRRLRVQVSGIGGTPIARQVPRYLPLLLGTAVLFTLLIACTNVAILMIAQWTAREREIAIRSSLGARRGRIVRLLLVESVLIAVCGGILGICATLALRALFIRQGPQANLYDTSIDPAVFAQAVAISVAAGILTGMAPALYETRRLQMNPLRLLTTSDRARQRWRHALVVFEITVTVALLVVTGAMISGYRRMLSMDLGFRTAPLLVARVNNAAGVPITQALDALREVPGAASVAASTVVPLFSRGPQQRVATDAAGSNGMSAERVSIGLDFFATIDVPLLVGRDFTPQDTSAVSRATIVNAELAGRLWPGRDPIGAPLWIDGASYEVVGVVRGFTSSPLERLRPVFYRPVAETDAPARISFVVRAAGDPTVLVSPVRRRIRALARGEITASVFTIDQVMAVGAQEIRIGTYPLVPLISTGMLLTAAGVYGVLAFAIVRRSRELAVRVAVGATSSDLLWLVVGHSGQLVIGGTLFGVAAAFGLTRLVQGQGGVFDSPGWQAFVVPVAIIAVIGGLAAWIPSRRVLRIDPAALLRAD